MIACMRRFDSTSYCDSVWTEFDLEGNEKTEVVREPIRKVVLMFLQGIDPNDIYAIDTGTNCIIVYYRRRA